MPTLHLSPATVPPRPSRRWRLAVALVALPVGIGAIFGGYGLLRDAEGLGAKPDWLEGSPFPDYTVPGVVLLVVIGGGLCATAAAALLRSPRAPTAAGVMGLVLLLWGLVETVTIGYRGAPQIVMLVLFVVAPAVTLVALARGQRRSTAPDRPMPATGVGPQADVRQSRTSLRAGTDGPAPGRREHGSVVERRTP